MLVLTAFLLGCALGWYRAAQGGGTLAQRIQYALAHGIPIGLATLVAVVLYARFYGVT